MSGAKVRAIVVTLRDRDYGTPTGMVFADPSPRFPTNQAPISRHGTTSSPPCEGASFVVTPWHVRPDTMQGAPHPVVGIRNTGMILLGVDHLKHPSCCVAERRSRPVGTSDAERGELRSVERLGGVVEKVPNGGVAFLVDDVGSFKECVSEVSCFVDTQGLGWDLAVP